MAAAGRKSTIGSTPAESRPAPRKALRLLRFFTSNWRRFSSWRFIAWTTRTPVMFSFSDALTTEIVARAWMNVFLAKGCHTAIAMASSGRTASASSPSCRSSSSITATIPPRLRKSPTVMTMVPRNSWSWYTSPCTRDMMRPTSVLSKKRMDCFCICENMSCRSASRTPCPALVMVMSCT